MAKTGDTPDRKGKPKPRARGARPSFAAPSAPAAAPAWVYRSDAPAAAVAKPAVTAKPAAAAKPVHAKAPVKAAARPAAARPRPARAPIAAPAASRSSRVTHALDVVTMPIAVSLMAVLVPMRWLLGPSRR